jgi:hypothetical protein
MNLTISEEIGSSLLQHLLINILSLIRTLIAPMLFGGVLMGLFAIFFILVMLRRISLSRAHVLLLIPVFLLWFVLIVLYPMGRPLIATLPIIISFSAVSWNYITDRSFRLRQVLVVACLAVLFAQTTFPFTGGRLTNSSVGYYRALDRIHAPNGANVFSRELTLSLYISQYSYCTSDSRCEGKIDYFLLSESDRAKLTHKLPFERNLSDLSSFDYLGLKYKKDGVVKGRFESVYIYKRVG